MTQPTLYINGRFLTQRLTGTQRFARELVDALDWRLAAAARPPRCVIVLPADSDPPGPWHHIKDLRAGRLSGHRWEQFELPRLTRDGVLLGLGNVGPLTHPRQAVVMHDAAVYALPEAFTWPFRTAYRVLLPLLARKAARLITISKFSQSELARYLKVDPKRFTVIAEGADHILRAESDAAILAAHGLQPRRYVLCVGSATPNKNFAAVAAAFSLLDRSDLTLAIAGGADSRIFADGTLLPSSRIARLGYVTDGALRALYENALCFVFPSRYEGFGLPPLEAMNCGCPVVASTAAAVREVCGQAALFADPDDHTAMAGHIARLADDADLWIRMATLGRQRVEPYTWAHSADAVLAAVQSLLAPTGVPRNSARHR